MQSRQYRLYHAMRVNSAPLVAASAIPNDADGGDYSFADDTAFHQIILFILINDLRIDRYSGVIRFLHIGQNFRFISISAS